MSQTSAATASEVQRGAWDLPLNLDLQIAISQPLGAARAVGVALLRSPGCIACLSPAPMRHPRSSGQRAVCRGAPAESSGWVLPSPATPRVLWRSAVVAQGLLSFTLLLGSADLQVCRTWRC